MSGQDNSVARAPDDPGIASPVLRRTVQQGLSGSQFRSKEMAPNALRQFSRLRVRFQQKRGDSRRHGAPFIGSVRPRQGHKQRPRLG